MAALYIKESAKLKCFSGTDKHIRASLFKHFYDLKDQQKQLEAKRARLEADYCQSGYIPRSCQSHVLTLHLQV